MRCEVDLVIEWEKSEGSDGSIIQSMADVMEYIQSTVESNALFDHIEMSVKNAAVKDLSE